MKRAVRLTRSARLLIALLFVALAWPAGVVSAQQSAGVVTTLSGRATVARASLTQPLPLKFKDDVYLRDRINTSENSVVRLLLGGKAVVTIRELSVLTVTEEIGRATINLDSGRVAISASRKRMKPGEEIEVRTPNAVAAVRGTVMVVEVLRASAQVGPGVPTALTNVHCLEGTCAYGLLGALQTLPGGLSVNILGGVLGTPYPTPAHIAQLLNVPQQFSPETSDETVEKQQGQAGALAATLVTGEVQNPFALLSQFQVPSVPIIPPVALSGQVQPPQILPPPPSDAPDIKISGDLVTLALGESLSFTIQPDGVHINPGSTLKTFSGDVTRTGTSPLIDIDQSRLIFSGFDNVIQVNPGADVDLRRQLLRIRDSSIKNGRHLLDVQGTLTYTGGAPLIEADPTTIVVDGLVSVTGTLALAAPLFSDLGGHVTTHEDAFAVLPGATPTRRYRPSARSDG